MTYINTLSPSDNQKFKQAILLGYFDDYEKDPRKWKHTFAGAFIWKNPTRIKVLEVFRELLGHIPTWEDLTDMNLEDFAEAIQNGRSANTVKNRFAIVKAVINRHIFEVNIPSRIFSHILTAREEPSQSVYRTEEEIRRIHDYRPQTPTEEAVRKYFLIEAFTGARNCDSVRLSPSNCDMDTNTLTYISKKTKTQITLPVHAKLMMLLCTRTQEMPTLLTFNLTLRKICQRCGINETRTLFYHGAEQTKEKWEFVGSHTGRRSFATNLYLRGADPATIARFMGHSSPEITIRRYILAYREVSDQIMAFFN